MESIEEQTALFPLVLETEGNQEVYMLPRRYLSEETKALNEIYTNVAQEPQKMVTKSEFLRGGFIFCCSNV